MLKNDSLVQKSFAVLLTRVNRFSNPPYTERVCLWTLKKTAIRPNHVVHAILRRPMEFYCIR